MAKGQQATPQKMEQAEAVPVSPQQPMAAPGPTQPPQQPRLKPTADQCFAIVQARLLHLYSRGNLNSPLEKEELAILFNLWLSLKENRAQRDLALRMHVELHNVQA